MKKYTVWVTVQPLVITTRITTNIYISSSTVSLELFVIEQPSTIVYNKMLLHYSTPLDMGVYRIETACSTRYGLFGEL